MELMIKVHNGGRKKVLFMVQNFCVSYKRVREEVRTMGVVWKEKISRKGRKRKGNVPELL